MKLALLQLNPTVGALEENAHGIIEAARAAERRGAELAGLLAGAAAEWFAKTTSDPAVRAHTLPDLRMMRPAGMPRELWFGRIGCSSDTSR